MVQPPFLHLHPASGVASFGRRGGVHPSLPGLQPRRGCVDGGVDAYPHIVAYGANVGLLKL